MKYLRNAKATDFKFCPRLATKSTNLQMTNCALWGMARAVTHYRISHPLKYLWNGWSYSGQILCACRL